MSFSAVPASTTATALPLSEARLSQAKIRHDETVSLTSLGLWYNWNILPEDLFAAGSPDYLQFRDLASKEARNDFGSLRIDGDDGGCLVLSLNDDTARQAIRTASLQRPVAAVSVDFCATSKSPLLKGSDLLRLSRIDGEFHLNGEPIQWKNEDQGEPLCWVEDRGRAYHFTKYPWLATHPVLGRLLEMKESSLSACFPEEGDAALLLLRDDPKRWVGVMLDYTQRFGNESAFEFLGAENISALLGCRLWQHLGLDTLHLRRAAYADQKQGVFPLKN